jgi:elongation factor P
MISAIQMRKGNVIIYKGAPHRVLDRHHRTPGKGAAIIRARLRNLKSGASYEIRFNSQESVEQVSVEQHQMEYLYTDGMHFHFMNIHNYEQIALNAETLGGLKNFLKEGLNIEVEFYEGDPIGIQMPTVVELKIVETEPELKGATASNSPKPATLETGAVVQVPPFISVGEMVRVDPNEGKYLERAK